MLREYWPTAEWREADPKNVDIDADKLALLNTAIQTQYTNLNGIIIVKNGYLALEKYYRRKNAMTVHSVASVTKSVTSALVGIAIGQGYIKSVDERVLDFFPEYTFAFTEKRKYDVSLRHLLTMTAPYPFKNWREPLDKMRRQSNWVGYAIVMLGQGGRLGTFKYSTAGAHLLSAVITRATGKCAREYANENLFRPLGMAEIPDNELQTYELEDVFGRRVKGWVHDPKGNSAGGWGLTLTLRDMARFGYLYLNDGFWNNKQILPETWVADTTAINSNGYGYMWWLRSVGGHFAYAAMGDGGNMICCIPEKDLVIAIASQIIRRPRDRWTLIERVILPAIAE